MMLSPGIQYALRAAKEVWWKVATRKTVEAAARIASSEKTKKVIETAKMIATSEHAKKAAEIAAEQGVRRVLEKKTKGPSLKKRLKKLDKMLRKGTLRPQEYETLRKQVIEEAGAANL